MCEVLGPSISSGYGYTAIIATFIGRLNPLSIILFSNVMGLLSVVGELVQIKLGLPLALPGMFQGILFLFPFSSRYINLQPSTSDVIERQGG
ncbi:hypothetical protein [Nostoc sp.]|uniref:hypothetical protein n=1 Tax=Nostoc sp. TaxID=1180 RepID=UPI002FFB54DA